MFEDDVSRGLFTREHLLTPIEMRFVVVEKCGSWY